MAFAEVRPDTDVAAPDAPSDRDEHLVLDRLCKRYGETVAVSELNLAVKQGEFIALLGPSGCGKTTALRMIAGLVPVTGGRVIVGGHEITHLPPYRRDIGLVFQNYALFPHLTVGQNIAFGLEMRRTSKAEISKRVIDALSMVRLAPFIDRKPRELSGGQQQRIALARALVIRPRILLLDEPLSNLDAKLRDEMRIEIRDIQRKLGITTVFVTHDQVEALSMCDRIAVQNMGELIQFGTPFEIYERPQTPFVAEFVGRTNRLSGVVDEPGVVSVGALKVFVKNTPPKDAAVILMIRPHRIQIGPAHANARLGPPANTVAGIVKRVTYVGDLLQYDVSIGADSIQIERPTATGPQPFTVGDQVELTWASADTLVFRVTA